MPIPLRRDDQQWVFDKVIKDTGRVFHFQPDGRGPLPASVKQHDMIAKHLGREAWRQLRIAQVEEEAGHEQTALDLYFDAAYLFSNAQHTIFENSEDKQTLHGLSIDAYDRVRALAPYPIEHVRIPWGDQFVYANLHLLPDRRKAPCVVVIPGCDLTKEVYPHPFQNQAHLRGAHVLVMDGPGQGECNLAGVKLTADNYETAVSAVVDYLETREEIDADALVLFSLSFGSYWGFRTAAAEHRFKAAAVVWASIAAKHHQMNEADSPRYKQLFAYLTGARSEEELDEILDAMVCGPVAGQIACPTLLTVGEYDPRSPLEEVKAIYDLMTCERELWVHEDQHHVCSVVQRPYRQHWATDGFWWGMDWLLDRLKDKPVPDSGEVKWVRTGGLGPNAEPPEARSWLELAGVHRHDVALTPDI